MNTLLACAACYGQSDSPMAHGMNWGIFSLLTVVVGVLGTIAAFFIYLARRAAANPHSPDGGNKLKPASAGSCCAASFELQTGGSFQPSITTH
jgi:hypothetical protein